MKHALTALALASLFATVACAPVPGDKAPFSNRNPYRIEDTRVVQRTALPRKQATDIEIREPIYFSERTGHILIPKMIDGQRTFLRSNQMLQEGTVYYNAATGQRMQVSRSADGQYRLLPVTGVYIDQSQLSYVPPEALSQTAVSSPFAKRQVQAKPSMVGANIIFDGNRGSINYDATVSDREASNLASTSCAEIGRAAEWQAPLSMPNGSKTLSFDCKAG